MESHSVEIVALVASQLVTLLVYVISTRERVNALSERVRAQDAHHKEHYAHAARTDIHQVSLSAELIRSEFSSLVSQFNQHSTDDRALFNEIKAELKDIRAAVQDVRENLVKR